MKYFLLLAISFSVLLSCQTTDKKPTDQTNELIDQFKSVLQGTWMPEKYIDEIEKTKSPLLSSDNAGFVSELIIDTTDIAGDSLRVGAAYGNHEGGDFLVFFKKGQAPNSLITNLSSFEEPPGSQELGYMIRNNEVSLLLYRYDKNKKLLDKTTYIKVPIATGDLSDGFQYMVNKKLFSGTYQATDSTGADTKVVLTDEGKISGFQNFKSYYILTDFVAGPENVTDEICFEIQTKHQKCYGFNIIADTINLFEPAKDEQDTAFKPGPTIYKFVRQR